MWLNLSQRHPDKHMDSNPLRTSGYETWRAYILAEKFLQPSVGLITKGKLDCNVFKPRRNVCSDNVGTASSLSQ